MQGLVTRNAKLILLSLVHVSSIPLFLAVGPSLEVSTDNDTTMAWLGESLLGDHGQVSQHDASCEPWCESLGRQSDQGILLQVEDEGADTGTLRPITEMLLYAAFDNDRMSLPSPPASSSPAPSCDGCISPQDGPRVAKVYALPLSSALIEQIANSVHSITQNPEDPNRPTGACFLPHDLDQQRKLQRAYQKRQNLSSLFDEATHKRRKFKGRGGESVAQAMANIDCLVSQNEFPLELRSESQNQPPKSAVDTKTRRNLSRVSSITSAPGSDYTQSVSRQGALANGKRSLLHRVESAASPCDSPTFPELDDSINSQNKAALTKIVMAGMRLYGLQQKKKKPGKTQDNEDRTNNPDELDCEDEYKLVYHQTFKAASFAFRRQFFAQVIPQEIMRDIVDRFLNLFCTDPTASADLGNGGIPGFGSQGVEHFGGFDQPSNKNSSPMASQTLVKPSIANR